MSQVIQKMLPYNNNRKLKKKKKKKEEEGYLEDVEALGQSR